MQHFDGYELQPIMQLWFSLCSTASLHEYGSPGSPSAVVSTSAIPSNCHFQNFGTWSGLLRCKYFYDNRYGCNMNLRCQMDWHSQHLASHASFHKTICHGWLQGSPTSIGFRLVSQGEAAEMFLHFVSNDLPEYWKRDFAAIERIIWCSACSFFRQDFYATSGTFDA